MSQVMGVQVVETDRDKATPTFYIKPVTIEGVGNAERLEDKGKHFTSVAQSFSLP